MRRKQKKAFIHFYLLLFLIANSIVGQEKVTMSGYIIDQETNETLIGVNVILPKIQYGATTNEYGFYSITVPKGSYQLRISYLGYESFQEELQLDKTITKDYKLKSEVALLEEVVV